MQLFPFRAILAFKCFGKFLCFGWTVRDRRMISRAVSSLPYLRDKESLGVVVLRPDAEAFFHVGGIASPVKFLDGKASLQRQVNVLKAGIAVMLEQMADDTFVLLRLERAGGIHHRSARFQRLERGPDQLLLRPREARDHAGVPHDERLEALPDGAGARAGGVDEDPVELLPCALELLAVHPAY